MLKREDLKDGVKLRMPSEEGTPSEFATVRLIDKDYMEALVDDPDNPGETFSAGVYPVVMYLEHFLAEGVELVEEQKSAD